jgi:rare lipoprotein A
VGRRSQGVRLRGAVFIFAGILVSGCAQRVAPPPPPVPRAVGPSLTGIASWYGPGFNGHRTSSGTIYNQEDLTAASTLFPLGTELLVTNLGNRRSVEVLVNDHGPYVDGRGLDLSHRAAVLLGIVKPGTAPVRMDVLWAPPGGPPLGQRYFVQVGSFADVANAERFRARLAQYYSDVQVNEAEVDDVRCYRVRMGAFMDRAAAEQRARLVSGIGFKPVIISE